MFPSFWKRKSRWWLNSSVGVAFYAGTRFLLRFRLLSVFSLILLTLFSLGFFSAVSLPCLIGFSSLSSSLLVSVPPLAFIAQGKHCGGNGHRGSNHKTCPIIGAICCKTYPWFNAENGFEGDNKQCMKRRRFVQNALFHLKGKGAKMRDLKLSPQCARVFTI